MAEATAGSHSAQGALDEFARRARPFSPPPGSLRGGRLVPVRGRRFRGVLAPLGFKPLLEIDLKGIMGLDWWPQRSQMSRTRVARGCGLPGCVAAPC